MTAAIYTDVLIVGGGMGGAAAAAALRKQGFAGSIRIVGDEVYVPYDRPPLSKAFLAEGGDPERFALRADGFWAEQRIDVETGVKIAVIEPRSTTAIAQNGRHYAYKQLIWAAGGRARQLACPGADLAGIHTIRNVADVLKLRAELPQVRNVAVIGAGFIGLEAAAVLARLGMSVNVIEQADRVMARVAGPEVSDYFEQLHRRESVSFHLSAAIDRLIGDDVGRIVGCALANGQTIDAELAIVGIGMMPNVGPLQDIGVARPQGVPVDAFGQSAIETIFVIGDCALPQHPLQADVLQRIESVQNANDQAEVVAKKICGVPEPYAAVPWFWSDQYDSKFQSVGLQRDNCSRMTRGSVEAGQFTILYLRGGNLVAADCVNASRDFMQARKLIGAQLATDPATLCDMNVPLKSCF